jgi:hypothetical protein
MADTVIAPLAGEWLIPPDLAGRIAAWETAVGFRLAASYRAFLVRYNGGRPYPNVFDVAIPDAVWGSADKQTFLDQFYDFDYAADVVSGSTYGAGTPAGFMFIGSNPGGLELILSMRAGDAGAVYCWTGTDVPWDTGANTAAALHLQTLSFPDLVASLYDTADRIGYEYWESPRHKLLAQPLVVG